MKDDNAEILALLEARLRLGIRRYGHGVVVDDNTTKYGTDSDDWELVHSADKRFTCENRSTAKRIFGRRSISAKWTGRGKNLRRTQTKRSVERTDMFTPRK